MLRRILAVGLAVLIAALMSWSADPRAQAADKDDANHLSMEVEALQLLYQMELTTDQLKALAKLGQDTASKKERKEAKSSADYVKVLSGLREALSKGDADKIDELNEKMDKLKEGQKLDDRPDVTDAARKKAADAVKLLTAKQVVDHFNNYYGEELPEPGRLVRAALEDGLTKEGADWEKVRDSTANEVSWVLGGVDADKAKKIKEQVAALLDKAHTKKEDELKKNLPEAEKAVKEMAGDLGPVEMLRNIVQRDMAELLSNPRLQSAIEGRLKGAK